MLVNDIVVRSTRTPDPADQELTYTEAQNTSDNGSFANVVTFRVYAFSIYGRSRNYEEITITSV